ncbi:MAG: pitrilysin family protein [Rhizomicrobium sp.]
MTALSKTLSRIAISALLVAACMAEAQAAPANPPRTFQFVLQNGLQVVVVPDHRAPVVTEMLWFKVGAVDDPPGISGLAHFFEHMMFRGTRALPGDGFSQTIARNGGDDNAFTTHDCTVFHEQIAKDRLRLAMHLEADRMANLDLSDSAVGTERDVVLAERRMRVDNDPEALTQEQAEAALYLSHPYGRPVIGWPDEIRHIGRVEADDFYRRHFAPNNAILIVAGDVTVDDVRAAAEAEYGPLPSHELGVRADYAQPPRLGETRLVIARKDAKVPMLLRLYRVQSYAEAAPGRAEALEVLAKLLGGDATSVLYRRLVVERRLATDVSAYYNGYTRDAGEFGFTSRPRPGVSLDALEHAIDEVVAPYLRRTASKAEVARAKVQLVAGATFRRDSPFEMASAYGRALAIGLTVFDVQQWPARIQAVTREDVRKAAAASLAKKESVTAYMMPASQ